ncbi:shikimate dehydrogenase [Thermodesulfobacteriota bacterium]
MKEIQKLRHRIDEIDDQILELINQRLLTAREIGAIKDRSGTAIVDSARETQIYQRLSSVNKGPLKENGLHHIFRAVLAAGRGIQTPGNKSGVAPLYVVVGNPIDHSLSPVMHNSALAHSGLDGCYLALRVEKIAAAVDGIRGLGIRGASVTIPHKIAVLPYLDKLDPMASDIGAVNTILNKDGVLHGYNSDCNGAVMAIAEKTAIKDKAAAIIGAGGAARALGFGLKQEGAMVTIINRTKTRGEKLAKDLECQFISLEEVKELPYHLVVNATPAGMTPDVNSIPIATKFLKPEMVIMDMVYNPLQTRFLKEAKIIGCTIVDGVSMFVHQGAVQFELWTSHEAPVDIMRKVVLEELKGQ